MLVIVDLDDTLCNTWEAGKGALLKLILYLLRRGKLRLVTYFLLGKYRELELLKRYHVMDIEDVVREVLTSVDPDISREELSRIISMVDREFFSRLRFYPDALPFLRGLKELGARIVLVTDSSSQWQRKKIEILGIGKFFDDIIISGETGHSKLEPYNFLLAVSRFKDDEVYVVGDRDETDMAGAKAIGAVGILVKRGYFRRKSSKNADYIVNNLLEALEVIKNARRHKD